MAQEGITAGGGTDANIALLQILKTTLIYDGLAHGIHEADKTLDKHQAHLCVFVSNCDEPMYVELVEALCTEHQNKLIEVDDNKKLSEQIGLCKIDREGKPSKVMGCTKDIINWALMSRQAWIIGEHYEKCENGM
uniref:40S ribosomal protein S12 n=1 Tax=Salvator merianae TaxID=96440 RepID=A0A8D0BKN4_SALMN